VVRIPGPNGGFLLLIDCGTRTGDLGLLEAAIQQLKTELPPGTRAGSRRLDLLVATHRHDDRRGTASSRSTCVREPSTG
jgi:glyoxylase-like metal-dependent hydrolase (beta-lactamase superfamily II)